MCGWSTRTTAEFLQRLEREGLLVKLRYSHTEPGQVTGYAVALTEAGDGQPAWHGGSHLAADLALPRLQRGWADPEPAPGEHE
jgi:hypothetical protein